MWHFALNKCRIQCDHWKIPYDSAHQCWSTWIFLLLAAFLCASASWWLVQVGSCMKGYCGTACKRNWLQIGCTDLHPACVKTLLLVASTYLLSKEEKKDNIHDDTQEKTKNERKKKKNDNSTVCVVCKHNNLFSRVTSLDWRMLSAH